MEIIRPHILFELLDREFSIRYTVRSQSKGDKILSDFQSQRSQIDICILSHITESGAYDEAVKRNPPLEAVIHTASPFLYGAVEDNLEFLDPAIKGTVGLLTSIKDHAPSVRRVVFTSSCASTIDYDHLTSDPPKVYTEDTGTQSYGKKLYIANNPKHIV